MGQGSRQLTWGNKGSNETGILPSSEPIAWVAGVINHKLNFASQLQ